MSAGELVRLPPMAVKLNGEIGEDEALERAVLHAVPDARRGDRLLLVDPVHERDVEAEEVDQLAGRVDLRLVDGLRLAEHRGRVDRVAPRPGEQLGGAEEDRGALLPGDAVPVLPGLAGRLDRRLDLLRPALVDVGQDVRLGVRHDGLGGLAGADVLAADDERDRRSRSPAISRSRFWRLSRSGEPGR